MKPPRSHFFSEQDNCNFPPLSSRCLFPTSFHLKRMPVPDPLQFPHILVKSSATRLGVLTVVWPLE